MTLSGRMLNIKNEHLLGLLPFAGLVSVSGMLTSISPSLRLFLLGDDDLRMWTASADSSLDFYRALFALDFFHGINQGTIWLVRVTCPSILYIISSPPM